MTTIVRFADIKSLVGTDLGASSWFEVTQQRINTFADSTDDHQWIHVDPERAKDGPFGGPIAHGYLTLSLLVPMWKELLEVTDTSTTVNYGLNKVRFPSPVPAGARIRLAGTVTQVQEVADGGVQLTAEVVIEIDKGTKPACIAQPVFRFYR